MNGIRTSYLLVQVIESTALPTKPPRVSKIWTLKFRWYPLRGISFSDLYNHRWRLTVIWLSERRNVFTSEWSWTTYTWPCTWKKSKITSEQTQPGFELATFRSRSSNRPTYQLSHHGWVKVDLWKSADTLYVELAFQLYTSNVGVWQ